MEYSGYKDIPENFWNKYIRKLTVEQILHIVDLCFNKSDVEMILSTPELIEVYGENFEFAFSSYSLHKWHRCNDLKADAMERYLEYMYSLFGSTYIEDYFILKYDLYRLEDDVKKAKQALSNAQIRCGIAISEYCETHRKS